MNISKLGQTVTTKISKPAAKKLQTGTMSDTFEKTTQKAAQKINEKFLEIVGTDNIPIYKSTSDFKKPVLGFIGKSQADQALQFNSSVDTQKATLECVKNIKKYLEQQIADKNVAKTSKTIGSAFCEFKNGVTLDVYEPYSFSEYAMKYDPKKILTLGLNNSKEQIALKAYNQECNSAIFEFFRILEHL